MTKRKHDDAFARLAASSSAKSGRGSETGWCRCPLCPANSKKVFAAGRGLAAHLHAVHTPWNPSVKELKRIKKQKYLDKLHGVSRKKRNLVLMEQLSDDENTPSTWEPTEQEVETWYKRVHYITVHAPALPVPIHNASQNKSLAYDRSGSEYKPYRDSLPLFLLAAANGDLKTLKSMVQDCKRKTQSTSMNKTVVELLNTIDRNGSIADHWAAGGGHIDCLKYLLSLRCDLKIIGSDLEKTTCDHQKTRRRDGKSTLHYAARHGKIDSIRIILNTLKECKRIEPDVDIISGDGTTPLHLACYGGHFEAVKFLIEECNAQVTKSNAWGCDSSHWVCMSVGEMQSTLDICNYLKHTCKIPFTKVQYQGHTPLHKAAQKKNDYIIKWLSNHIESGHNLGQLKVLGKEDHGGNRPSDIYISFGGSKDFATWMKNTYNW